MDVRAHSGGVFVFGPFRLDPLRRALTRNGAPVELSQRVFDTLLYLVEHPGQLLTKDELLEAIWPGRTVDEGNLSQAIFALRKALDVEPSPIITAPGRGYRLALPVKVEALEPALSPATSPKAPWPVVTVAAAALLIVAGAGDLAWRALRPLAQPRTLVLADIQDLTGDSGLARVLGRALEVDFGQSPQFVVLSRQQVDDTLELMAQRPVSSLTPELAKDVCRRNGGGAVVSGSAASLGGGRYLVTLGADDCATGRTLVEAKVDAVGKEGAVRALDTMAGRVRAKLGESVGSIAKFDVPLLATRTSSFEALEAYSEAVSLYGRGKRAEAVPLLQQAVKLDPDFTMAWADLGAAYYALHQEDRAAEATGRAYALRANADQHEQLIIAVRYDEDVTGDIEAAIRDLRMWTELYPDDPKGWANLANAEGWIGQHPAELDAARRALAANPNSEAVYAIAVRAYRRSNQFDRAVATGRQAIVKGLAGGDVRAQLAQIAFWRGDEAGLDEQIAWSRGKTAERTLLVDRTVMAMSQGRLKAAQELDDQLAELGRQQGFADPTVAARARLLIDFGLGDEARALLSGLPVAIDDPDYRYAVAEVGDEKTAAAILQKALAKAPADTLLNRDFAPSVRAALLMRGGRAAEAVDVLRPAFPFELRSPDLMYQAGYAYLASGDPKSAANKFQMVLANPGLQPDSPLLPLAKLGLARAMARQGDRAGARGQYEAFLSAWKNADPGIPVLVQARRELAALQGARAAH